MTRFSLSPTTSVSVSFDEASFSSSSKSDFMIEECINPLGYPTNSSYGITQFSLTPPSTNTLKKIDENSTSSPNKYIKKKILKSSFKRSDTIILIKQYYRSQRRLIDHSHVMEIGPHFEKSRESESVSLSLNNLELATYYSNIAEKQRKEMEEILLRAKERENKLSTKYRERIHALKELIVNDIEGAKLVLAIEKEKVEKLRKIQENKEKNKKYPMKQHYENSPKKGKETRIHAEEINTNTREMREIIKKKIVTPKIPNDYVNHAKKIVLDLETMRQKICHFEHEINSSISRRRLKMKKIARGKLNILKHDHKKIVNVVENVVDAIQDVMKEDEINNNSCEEWMEGVGLGTAYFMDLVCCTTLVRVQAESFNGTKGDGFPLAGFLSHTSCRLGYNFSTLVEAHIFNVCPMAIPFLPLPENSDNEAGLMNSLCMYKDEDGEYETFSRFISRIEGLISIMAQIMSSKPINHSLFGGQKGALQWLERFLNILHINHDYFSPLPLITAPILVAFLTASGHMLSKVYPNEFMPLISRIKNDILKRLDVSTIGKPSYTRLTKMVVFDLNTEGIYSTLPIGAVRELYSISDAAENMNCYRSKTSISTHAYAGGRYNTNDFNGYSVDTNTISIPSSKNDMFENKSCASAEISSHDGNITKDTKSKVCFNRLNSQPMSSFVNTTIPVKSMFLYTSNGLKSTNIMSTDESTSQLFNPTINKTIPTPFEISSDNSKTITNHSSPYEAGSSSMMNSKDKGFSFKTSSNMFTGNDSAMLLSSSEQTSIFAPPRVRSNKSINILCKYYSMGICNQGSQCKFSHCNPYSSSIHNIPSRDASNTSFTNEENKLSHFGVSNNIIQTNTISERINQPKNNKIRSSNQRICKFYLQGNCRQGTNCNFFHPQDKQYLNASPFGLCASENINKSQINVSNSSLSIGYGNMTPFGHPRT